MTWVEENPGAWRCHTRYGRIYLYRRAGTTAWFWFYSYAPFGVRDCAVGGDGVEKAKERALEGVRVLLQVESASCG